MFGRITGNRTREVPLCLFSILIICALLFYLYLMYLQEHNKSVEMAESRCMSELASTKYQLNVVTEYKNKMDKMLTEAQKANEAEKERYKEMTEGCNAMKHQAAICQSQFEDLESECRKLKESNIKLKNDIRDLHPDTKNR